MKREVKKYLYDIKTDKVDDVVIWGNISNHLPKLKIEIDKYLDQE